MHTIDHELDVLMRARYPVIYVVSYEEARVEHALRSIVDGRRQVLVWSATEPFSVADIDSRYEPYGRIPLDGLGQALDALNFILKKLRETDMRAVFILRDFDAYLENPVIVRRLRDVIALLRGSYSTIVILSPSLTVPAHLDKEIVVVDYDLPALCDLREILQELARRVANDEALAIDWEQPPYESLARAALGLTADEATNVFSKAMVCSGGLEAMDVEVVLSEKKQILRKTGMLEFYEADATMAGIGGLTRLKAWLGKRSRAFSDRARAFGLPAPRGVLLLGVPGCGKSLTARAIGASWQLPLLRFDVGAVFGKYVGESEANLRRALRAAEAVSPCVLWIDELEKAFSPTRSDDGGTSLRILGGFLSWLQEKKAPVFVVGTANNIDMLPPELLRKGRLDEIFFVDLPQRHERADIFAIHLKRRGRDASRFDIPALVEKSEGYSGAEIEQAIIAALYDAFEDDRDVTTADIAHNLEAMVPLSRTMEEEVAQLRGWAASRARPASAPE